MRSQEMLGPEAIGRYAIHTPHRRHPDPGACHILDRLHALAQLLPPVPLRNLGRHVALQTPTGFDVA